MWRPAIFVAAAVAGVAIGAPGSKEPPKGGPPPLVGEWVCVEARVGGRAVPGDGVVVEFAPDGKAHVLSGPGTPPAETKYTADAAKDTIDYWQPDAKAPCPGIYKVDGDTLTLCMDEPGGKRPTAFESAAGSRVLLMTLKRRKPKE